MNGLGFGICMIIIAYVMTPRIDCALGVQAACTRISNWDIYK